MKVVVASKNPVKINASKSAFKKVFPDKKIDFVSVDVPSGVSAQPLGRTETIKGAINRTRNAFKKIKGDFYVGIEGGVNKKMDIETAWVVVRDIKGNLGKSSTSSFLLPHQVTNELRKGKELAEAADKISGTKNIKHNEGAIGWLTHGVIDRKKYYVQAIVIALIPFVNKKLYFEK